MPPAEPSSPRNQLKKPSFGPRELQEARWLIQRGLEEDVPQGDVTTEALFASTGKGSPSVVLEAAYVPREKGILCGAPIVRELFSGQAPDVQLVEHQEDGDRLIPGTPCLTVCGPVREVLRLERISLNFLGRLCGIASETDRWKAELAGTPASLLDTRKTTPGWRHLEKYAVRTGGGQNHRESLSDAILLKDNHAEVLRLVGRPSAASWVASLRESAPGVFLQLEVSSREECLAALDAAVDAILLDNFDVEDMEWAVQTRNARGQQGVLLEASGGMRLACLKEVAATGIDRISVGRLTHSAPSLDLGLDLVRVHGEAST